MQGMFIGGDPPFYGRPWWRRVVVRLVLATLAATTTLLVGCQALSPLAALFGAGLGGLARPSTSGPPPEGGSAGGAGDRDVVSPDPGTAFPVNLEPDDPGGEPRLPVPIAALRRFDLAGSGTAGFAGDGGPAEAAQFSAPAGIAWGRAGLVVADTGNHRLRRIEFDGTISTLAGTGTPGDDGDGGDARGLALSSPSRVAIDAYGNVFFSDTGNRLVRCVDPTGRLLTIAGGGTAVPGEEPEVATNVALAEPLGLAFAPDGVLHIADAGSGKILRFGTDGRLRALPGTFGRPIDVAVSPAGTVAVADASAREVLRVGPAGEKTAIAGPERLASAAGLAYGEAGDLLIADPAAGRIWLVGLGGEITAAVVTGSSAIAAGPRGQFFLADPAGNKLEALEPEPS